MDWYKTKVLSWNLYNATDTGFCVEAQENALAKYGKPEKVNTDPGRQFSSLGFVGLLQENLDKVAMDGSGTLHCGTTIL